MTIASDLVSINTTKGNIKTAIEAKGVTVGSVPFADYPGKIASITGGGGGYTEWTQAYYESVQAEADAAVAAAPAWVRPSDWLTMPTVTATEQKLVGLYPVFDSESNWVSIKASGAYTVDWGDGISQNFASNAIASHNYVYANISDTTLSTKGYRQVLITITPQAGQTLSNIDFFTNAPSGTYIYNWLDIVVAMNNAGTITQMTGTVSKRGLERFRWLGTNAQTNFGSFFSFASRLQVIELSTSTGTSGSNMFQGCSDLVTIPLLNTSNFTSFSDMFNGCLNLITIPLINVGKSTTFNNMFNGCSNLITVPLLDLSNSVINPTKSSTAFNLMFANCTNLKTIPALDFSKSQGMTQTFQNCRGLEFMPAINIPLATTLATMFSGCHSLIKIGDITTSTSLVTLTSVFDSCYLLKSIPTISTVSNVTNTSSMCTSCVSLTTFPEWSTPSVTITNSMFSGCTTLISVPSVIGGTSLSNPSNTFNGCPNLKSASLVCNTNSMGTIFYGCTELQTVSLTNSNTSQTIDCTGLFRDCSTIRDININLTGGGKIQSNMSNMFNNCSNLKTITGLSMNTGTTASTNTFLNCSNLSSVTLPGMVASLTAQNLYLGKQALVDLFTSLGTATAKTISINNNWGAALLTTADRLIATNKGWTIVG